MSYTRSGARSSLRDSVSVGVMAGTMFDELGGEDFFVRLVDAFYDEVERDETLRPMYPEDLAASKRHLVLFLVQYWGGPALYQSERGHPRLRLRHREFRITKRARDAWLNAMTSALTVVGGDLSDVQTGELIEYFTMAANQLRNV